MLCSKMPRRNEPNEPVYYISGAERRGDWKTNQDLQPFSGGLRFEGAGRAGRSAIAAHWRREEAGPAGGVLFPMFLTDLEALLLDGGMPADCVVRGDWEWTKRGQNVGIRLKARSVGNSEIALNGPAASVVLGTQDELICAAEEEAHFRAFHFHRCDHPWHRNPGLISPCPSCAEERTPLSPLGPRLIINRDAE